MSQWNFTRNSYINWLSDNNLKNKFLSEIKYKGFSLWWATKLVDRDNVNEEKWYYNLHLILNKKKIEKDDLSYFYFFFKFFKKFIKSLLFNLLIRIFVKKTRNSEKIKNCFFSFGNDLIETKKFYIDRQYGKASFINKNDNAYFVSLNEEIHFIKKILSFKNKIKKIPCRYFIADHYISSKEIINIYFFTLMQFFKIVISFKKKNFFIINNRDCRIPLEKKFLESFFGNIQNTLINGISVGNFVKKNKCKNLISYLEFYPLSRGIYYFSKLNDRKINLISINHANYSSDNLFFNFKREEFFNKRKELNSAKPDFFFCQGKKYFDKLNKIFDKKTLFLIGSLKLELNPYVGKKINKINPKIKGINNKKIILTIFTSLNDYKAFVEILNGANLSNCTVVLKPHPIKHQDTIDYFNSKFKHRYLFLKNFDSRKLIAMSNYIIFGDSSIGLEASIRKKNVFRIYHDDFIPTFNRDAEIPTIINNTRLKALISKKKIKQKSLLIEKNYFYKYDQFASKRLYKILDKI